MAEHWRVAKFLEDDSQGFSVDNSKCFCQINEDKVHVSVLLQASPLHLPNKVLSTVLHSGQKSHCVFEDFLWNEDDAG